MRDTATTETVRISLAAAMTLGFKKGRFYRDAKLGCINILMEYDKGCLANCQYCGQAREISDSPTCKNLIRVSWPSYPLERVIKATKQAARDDKFVQRVCVSALTRREAPRDLVEIVRRVKQGTGLKVSTLITPTAFKRKDLEAIKMAGAENVTIAVDCCTAGLFDRMRGKRVKGPHKWDRYLKGIEEAVQVMGKGRYSVGVHLIMGLGESEREAVAFMQRCYDLGARVHLFSFYPEKGSIMESGKQPPLDSYRRMQLARQLLDQKLARYEDMRFKDDVLVDFGISEEKLRSEVRRGSAFMTSGCPGCNRPFANETPTQAQQGLLRNYPFPPTRADIKLIEGQF